MLPDGPQNYTSIGVATILVFLNVILLHEGYKFIDMTYTVKNIGKFSYYVLGNFSLNP